MAGQAPNFLILLTKESNSAFSPPSTLLYNTVANLTAHEIGKERAEMKMPTLP